MLDRRRGYKSCNDDMRRRRCCEYLSLVGLVATFLLTAGLAVSAAPAGAVGCYGDYCSGQDPQATGCADDAQTVAWYDAQGARLELRWSPTCQTNWARFILYPQGWSYVHNATLSAVQDTGYTQSTSVESAGSDQTQTFWTPMIYSPVHCVKAVYDAQNGFDHAETACK